MDQKKVIIALSAAVAVLVAALIVVLVTRSDDGAPAAATTTVAATSTTTVAASSTVATVATTAVPSSTAASSTTKAVATTAAPATTAATTAAATTTAAAPTAATTTTKPATTSTTVAAIKLGDAAWEALAIGCIYQSSAKGACQQLVASGFTAATNYGVGNSLTQAPFGPLRGDCLAGKALSCAELNQRVKTQGGQSGPNSLLCTFFAIVSSRTGATLDTGHLATLLGPAAPPGVTAALQVLRTDPTNAAAVTSIDGYLVPVCGRG